jgi:hypothetical protein
MPDILQSSFSLIPLTLFYSSLTKLFLLFLFTIWRPTTTPVALSVPSNLSNATFFYSQYLLHGFKMLDDDKLDREWAIRNVLGGMSAGFGLRGMSFDAAEHRMANTEVLTNSDTGHTSNIHLDNHPFGMEG